MKARIEWASDSRFIGSTWGGQRVVMESSSLENTVRIGTSPMELILIGMGGCSSYDVVNILKKMRQPIKNVNCDVSAERANDTPAVFTRVHMVFIVTGKVPLAKVEKAVQLSIEKYCSASKMIGKTAEITADVSVINES